MAAIVAATQLAPEDARQQPAAVVRELYDAYRRLGYRPPVVAALTSDHVRGSDNAAARGGTRSDAQDGTASTIRVRGASFFHVRNGLIEKWTDYFDARTFTEQTK